MFAESSGYAGAFTEIEAAERAYKRLREEGLDDEHISLVVNEDCPACQEEQARARDACAERLITGGQIGGGLLGLGFGAALVWWPLPTTMHVSWLEWLVQLCVVTSWLLTGAILGAMVGAVAAEFRPSRRRLTHRHYILMLNPPHDKKQEALAILRHSRATIEGEGALRGTD